MSVFTIESLERVARERGWDRLLAKSPPQGEQSILSHAKAVTGIAETVGEMIGLPKELMDMLRVSAFLHDMGKEKDAFQKSLETKERTKHLPTLDEIRDILQSEYGIQDEFVTKVYFVIIETHRGLGETETAMRAVSELVDRGETPTLIELGEIVRLSDWMASSDSPASFFKNPRVVEFKPLLRENSIHLEYYSLLRIRGVLTYLLHRGIQSTFKKKGYEILASYPDGCILIGKEPLDKEWFQSEVKKQIKKILDKALLAPAFLDSAISLQINRGMIANPSIVALSALSNLVDFGIDRIHSLGGKDDDQKRAILMRYISTLQNALRTKIEEKGLEVPSELSDMEKEVFGIDFGAIGLPMDYELWKGLIQKSSAILVRNKTASRDLETLDITSGLASIKKAYKELIDKMKILFSADQFKFIETMETEGHLEALLRDIGHPSMLQKKDDIDSNEYTTFARHTLATYQKAKEQVMGKMTGDIRCPICGSADTGTKAISAAVGSGTKKFLNSGIGTKRLENINVCNLCILEGILRGNKDHGYVLLPQTAFSAQEAYALEHIAKKYLSKLDRNVFKTAAMLLRGELETVGATLRDRLSAICSSEREFYDISGDIVGNYVLMTTFAERKGSVSDNMAKAVFQGLILHHLMDVRVMILTGFEMIDINDRRGAVQFPGTSTLLRVLRSRENRVDFANTKVLVRRLAAALLAKYSANLSDNNGIIQALDTHPGQIAQRIALDRDSVKLSEHDLRILKILYEGYDMTSITDMTVEILDKYYRPEKYGKSMHSVLGPMNSLYTEFRKASKLDQEAIEAIAGKMHRQLQQLNKGDYMLAEAAAPILELCKALASRLEDAGPRDRKKILDDLRYSIYLRRLISINEKIEKKKGGN